LVFPLFHVSIEDGPLSHLPCELRHLRWISFSTFLSKRVIDCLRRSFLVVELVPKRLCRDIVIFLD
jgi:hypothetical protein